MGVQFFYCQSCGTRVTGEDLEAGEAERTDARIRCAACARKKKAPPPAAEPVRQDPALPAS